MAWPKKSPSMQSKGNFPGMMQMAAKGMGLQKETVAKGPKKKKGFSAGNSSKFSKALTQQREDSSNF